jgi:hypothetical protein
VSQRLTKAIQPNRRASKFRVALRLVNEKRGCDKMVKGPSANTLHSQAAQKVAFMLTSNASKYYVSVEGDNCNG